MEPGDGMRLHLTDAIRKRIAVLEAAKEREKAMKHLDDDTITRDELNAAVTRLGYNKLDASMIMNNVRRHREPQTVTREELLAAAATLTGQMDRYQTSDEWCAALLQAVADARSPQHPKEDYKVGTVVRDKTGTIYCRTQDGRWHGLRTTVAYADTVPARPLTVIPS